MPHSVAGRENKNITSLTTPLKIQFITFNPMDNKLLHLIITESQYLQFIKILSTSRYQANKLQLLSNELFEQLKVNVEYQDLLRSFSSDTTGDTNTENLTDLEDEEHLIVITKKNQNILPGDSIDHIGNATHLIERLDLNDTSEDDVDSITFEDLEKYEQLLTDFESTRDEEISLHNETPIQIETENFLEDLQENELNNSFTNYLRLKFENEEFTNTIINPQDFLRKVSKIWNLIPKDFEKTAKHNDKDQFHEFIMEWKRQRKTIPGNDDVQEEITQLDHKRSMLLQNIKQDVDIELTEDEITDELINEKISQLSTTSPSSPFDFFYNDKLKQLLQDKNNFNMKRKQINAQIRLQWQEISVLEKARYSTITIDNHQRDAKLVSSPNRRTASYHGSVPTSKLSSPLRCTSTSLVTLRLPPQFQILLHNENTILTPPVSPDDVEEDGQDQEVKKLNKKKSWGKDDRWL